VGGLALGVVDYPLADLRHYTTRNLFRRVVLHPVAADLLKLRTDNASRESPGTVLPDLRWLPPSFQAAPLRPHDRVIERDERFADPVDTPAGSF
jgi:hypothetical protein